MWEVYIFDENLGGSDVDLAANYDFMVYIMTATVPSTSVEMIKRRYMGQEYQVTGMETSPKQMQVSVWDDEYFTARRFFQYWIDTVVDPRHNRSVGGKAKKDVQIITKDTSDYGRTGFFDITGAMPTEIGETNLDYSANDIFTFDVTLSFNNLEMNGDFRSDIEPRETGFDAFRNIRGV